jgi:hypothetical protein
MASLAPSLGKPSTIGEIGSKCRGGRHDRTNYQVLRKAAELVCPSIGDNLLALGQGVRFASIRSEPRRSAQAAAR